MLQAALVLARLRSHPGRSLVLVVVVAVAAGIALSALAVLRVADDPWAPLQAATRGADVEIDAAPARPGPRALAALPEVTTVGSLIQSGDTALQVHGETLLMSLKRMPADREAMVVDRPRMMAGRWFAADGEVVFEATLADTLGVEVGDMVALNGEQGRMVRVAGTAATTMLPNYPERLPGSIFASGAVFDAIDPVGEPRWSIGLRLHDPSEADAVVARLNASGPVPPGRCPTVGWCARTAADIRDNAFPSRVDEFAQVMLFFAVLMLIAAVLLIVTLLGSRLVSEARELTLLQVVGATPARLAPLIATEHAVLAVAGAVAGILVARVVAPRIASSAATVFGSVSPRLSLGDVMVVSAAAVAISVVVSVLGGLRAGRRSLAVVARGGTGRIRRSRAAGLTIRSTSWTTLVLGLKDIATRRGRAAVIVLSVALAVTIAVAVVGLGTSELDPAIAPTGAAGLPADPAEISRLPVFSPAISQQVVGRVMTLIAAMQALLGGVAVVTLLAAASSRSRSGSESSACSTPWAAPPPSSQVPRRSARAPSERSAPPSASPWASVSTCSSRPWPGAASPAPRHRCPSPSSPGGLCRRRRRRRRPCPARPARPGQPGPRRRVARIATTGLLHVAGDLRRLGVSWFPHPPEEVEMVEIGDRVLVESEKVGSPTRSGVVTAVDDRLITVLWDSGSESIFVSSAGSLRVIGHEPPSEPTDGS